MPLGMEVGLGPVDFVFDGDPATPRKKGTMHPHTIFGPCLLCPNGWMDEAATWYGSRPRPRPHCIRRVPALAIRETGTAAPIFSARVNCGHGRPSQLLLSSCIIQFDKNYYLSPMGGCEVLQSLCLYVCQFVSLSTCLSQKPRVEISQNFLYMLPVCVAGSYSDSITICYFLPVL